MPLSQYIDRVEPSVTMAISAKAAAMKREGIDVIALSAGEPDFDTPQNIKDAGIRAIAEGFTKYTSPASGIVELKNAICHKFHKDNNLHFTPDQIIVNCGAKHSLYLGVAAVLNPGDEMIVPTPYWVTFVEQPKLVGANSVVVQTRQEEGLKLTPQALRAAITPRSRMLLLNSPSNPSGVVYTREELEALAAIVVEHELYVLSDEIYEKLVYDDTTHVSIGSLGDDIKRLSIIVNGASKAYAMTGWRIGYIGADSEVVAAMDKAQSQTVSHPTSISQKAALEALTGPQDMVEMMRREYDKRRCYIVDRLNNLDGVECTLPLGAFYVYPDVSSYYGACYEGTDGTRTVTDCRSLCTYLLEVGKVACVPGIGFGTLEHIRLSYATSIENIKEAMNRIESALFSLQR